MNHRRQFSPEFKAHVVLEVISGAKSAAEICREHQLKPDLLSKWKAQFLRDAAHVFQSPAPVDPAQARIADLEQMVGRLTLELEVAKKPRHSCGRRRGETPRDHALARRATVSHPVAV